MRVFVPPKHFSISFFLYPCFVVQLEYLFCIVRYAYPH
jgi:hypothetical protein